MHCKRCGKAIGTDRGICPFCGAMLTIDQMKIYEELGTVVTIGIYASNSSDEFYVEVKNELTKIIQKYKEIIQMHGFYVDEESKTISFDLIIDFKAESKEEIRDEVIKEIKEKYPEYNYYVILDTDISD